MSGALAYEFFTPPDPAFAITQFNFDRDPARMEAFSSVYDTYRDATLAEFRKRGGKLLIFHGTADPIFSALESIDYYQRLTRNNGGPEATSTWARLFLVPGMNHCAGGPATDSFDGLGAIVDWVEKVPRRRASRHRRVRARRTSGTDASALCDVNRRYHDVAAADYDAKWGVDFEVAGRRCSARSRSCSAAPRAVRALAGDRRRHGYFTLNLMQAGVIRRPAVRTDVSPGMLEALRANAERLGLEVETAACDAAALPFDDASFDLVGGHAVLHHLPELERSFAEFRARAAPRRGAVRGGAVAPRRPDRRAAEARGRRAAPLWRRLVARRAARLRERARRPDDHALEAIVDVHAFTPPTSSATPRPRASSACGSAARSCWRTGSAGSTARSRRPRRTTTIPHGWFRYAYHGYIVLQKVDAAVLEPHLPAAGLLQPDAHGAHRPHRAPLGEAP